jgi:two-component system sensor kinase FixL
MSILIVGCDAIALEQLRHAVQDRTKESCIVLNADRVAAYIAARAGADDCLLTTVDLPDGRSGWDLARLARGGSPDIPIGYLSADGLRDWAKHGVPNSVLINQATEPSEIAIAFLHFCRSPTRNGGTLRRFGARPAIAAAPVVSQIETDMQEPNGRITGNRAELHDVLMQAPGFVAWLDGPDHRFAFANTAYTDLVEREVVGQRVVDVLPEIEAQGFIDVLDRIYRSGEPFMIKGAAAEFELAGDARKQTMLDLNYHAVRDTRGTVTGIIVVGEDVTDEHRAQQRVGVLQNELLHISRINAMGTMVSTIAHELNQPLTAIHNFATVAKTIVERGGDPSAALEALEGTISAALRAGDIIRNLRAMTTRREVMREPILLEEAIREVAGLATLGEPSARIAFDIPRLVTVLGDKVLIQQVLFNLVRNALEAAQGATVDVTIKVAERDDVIEVCVADTGPGIDRTVLPSVFDSFVTTKAEGTGVGLAISKAIVEAHGGVITARNGAERGAIFCFTLAQL